MGSPFLAGWARRWQRYGTGAWAVVAKRDGGGQRSQVTPTTVFTVCASVLAVVVLVTFMAKTRVALTLTGIATILALALEHGVARLERGRLPRLAAIALVMTTLLVIVAALALLVIPAAADQLDALVRQWPQLMEELRSSRPIQVLSDRLQALGWARRLEEATPRLATGALPTLLIRAIGGVVGVVISALTVFFLVVFMLTFGGDLIRRGLALVGPEHRMRYVRVFHNVYSATGGYLSGLALICTINATLTTVTLALLGLPYFLPLGIASGFSSLVPYVGPLIAGGVITLLTWATQGIWAAAAALAYFLLYGPLEGNVLAPLVFRRTVHVNPLLVLLAVLFCAELAGIVGAVVAVPVAATLQIISREVLLFRQERRAARTIPPAEPE
ncbi:MULTISPECIES: AI-2E family transporter [Myxococcus]|uniref:AI-2E family transporter n=1 Tax=Myxococcus xanthus TaxID=34 RepID=A0AAE6KQ92_MYXXA|nr:MULTISPECIES: AI-2E family transporter [Myxococcus]QDE65800.1 AI-2E family transporter [Myxococcus xanthus]QDE73073.1 AI-2E family transporter [Myxococcus xanthus]QDE86883.1 AI-2E family transporter [Myxococcus xanthus]QDF01905.1 AI-2E family transporter [Myxococcus xanthus]WAM26826.1 AI-2E family transporter [Myxococcus sp. NMCA1]